jgi:hypothetical protein
MEPLHAEAQASHVVADAGNIIVDGPDGVAVTMSPDAAEETARRLLTAASERGARPARQATAAVKHLKFRSLR